MSINTQASKQINHQDLGLIQIIRDTLEGGRMYDTVSPNVIGGWRSLKKAKNVKKVSYIFRIGP